MNNQKQDINTFKVEAPLVKCSHRVADIEEYMQSEKEMAEVKPMFQRSMMFSEAVYEIALCFHIVHKGEDIGVSSNIIEEQINSAIRALNEDFSKEPFSNGDGAGAKSPFRFVLMNKDDEGNPTSGIYRVNGAALSTKFANEGIHADEPGVGENESTVKNWSRQNNQHVYNVWVVPEIDNNNAGSGIQGFAYFPTTSAVDGTVILYNATGTVGNQKSYTRLGRTLTHEIGHAFALFHTFNNTSSCTTTSPCEWSGDRVCDTPRTILNSNPNSPACGGTQQVENYMDYTPERVKDMFTAGQVERATLAAINSRANLLYGSDALANLSTLATSATFSIKMPPVATIGNELGLWIEVVNTGSNKIHTIDFQYEINGLITTDTWYGPIAPQGIYGIATLCLEKIEANVDLEISVTILKINDITVDMATQVHTLIVPQGPPCILTIVQDALMGQISWEIVRNFDQKVMYSNPSYQNFNGGELLIQEIGLPDGEYSFFLRDAVPGLNTPSAYIELEDPNGIIICHETGTFNELEFPLVIGENAYDFNGDGAVNIIDASMLAAAFGSSAGDENFNPKMDLNEDGHINIQDVSIWAEHFNEQND